MFWLTRWWHRLLKIISDENKTCENDWTEKAVFNPPFYSQKWSSVVSVQNKANKLLQIVLFIAIIICMTCYVTEPSETCTGLSESHVKINKYLLFRVEAVHLPQNGLFSRCSGFTRWCCSSSTLRSTCISIDCIDYRRIDIQLKSKLSTYYSCTLPCS